VFNSLQGEGQKSVFLRLLKLNAAEWPYLTLGCIASFLTGSAPPLFALAIGIMVQVRRLVALMLV